MQSDTILQYCLNNLQGESLRECYGERCIFFNPDGTLERGVYVLTVKDNDGACDKSSELYRQGVYRVNIGIRQETFIDMFSVKPARPAKGEAVDMPFDFAAIDVIMPHPVYAWMSWICVLNPSENTFDRLKPLIDEAYTLAKKKYLKRIRA